MWPRKTMTYDEELKNAEEIIRRSRDLTKTMMDDGFIAERRTEPAQRRSHDA